MLIVPTLSAAFLSIILWTDLKHRRIPNVVTFTAWVVGMILHLAFASWMGGVNAITGSCIGFTLMLIPFLMSGMGAGDVKAMAALGALIGPSAIFQTFLYMALIGGAISLAYYIIVYDVREKARAGLAALGAFAASLDIRCLAPAPSIKKHKIPYAPAMALGYIAFLAWGNLI